MQATKLHLTREKVLTVTVAGVSLTIEMYLQIHNKGFLKSL